MTRIRDEEHKSVSIIPINKTVLCRFCEVTVKFTHKNQGLCRKCNAFDKWLKNTYKIDIESYYDMLTKQDHKCAICLSKFGEGKREGPHIDHCHIRLQVRGLLCGRCNVGLGLFRDRFDVTLNAAKYLKENRHTGGWFNKSLDGTMKGVTFLH